MASNSMQDDGPTYSGSKMLLLSYCKNTLSEIGMQKEEAQGNDQKEIILNVYHSKCSSLITEITSLDDEALSFVVLTNLLQKIAQLVLDFTYVEECCLVDQDFLLQAAYERVTYIIETLSSIERLTTEVAPDNHLRDLVSPSIAECIHWRKGALLYMYCHTVNSRCGREQLPSHFLQCLQNGSKHLIAMLSTRSSPVWLSPASDSMDEASGVDTGSSIDQSEMLLSQGIYSDTHLLALMYLGEMCYWYAQLTQPSPSCDQIPGAGHNVRGDNNPSADTTASGDNWPSVQQGDATVGTSPSTGEVGDKVDLSPGLSCAASFSQCQTEVSGPSLSLQQGQSLDMLRVGQSCLENYISAAKGPMSAGGWSTDRAEEILQYFGNLTI
ncbi:hypothetical protein EGW08_007986 [Elysia chlorotica]|uniref:Uncharacterized protein n=1 Tax=Elysia chlorotica TaxID=188477 RepID=A0A3S0ZQ61_ELYCH|nr:hypothetical protein EGW08_007986 [Elysia chlorotica]